MQRTNSSTSRPPLAQRRVGSFDDNYSSGSPVIPLAPLQRSSSDTTSSWVYAKEGSTARLDASAKCNASPIMKSKPQFPSPGEPTMTATSRGKQQPQLIPLGKPQTVLLPISGSGRGLFSPTTSSSGIGPTHLPCVLTGVDTHAVWLGGSEVLSIDDESWKAQDVFREETTPTQQQLLQAEAKGRKAPKAHLSKASSQQKRSRKSRSHRRSQQSSGTEDELAPRPLDHDSSSDAVPATQRGREMQIGPQQGLTSPPSSGMPNGTWEDVMGELHGCDGVDHCVAEELGFVPPAHASQIKMNDPPSGRKNKRRPGC